MCKFNPNEHYEVVEVNGNKYLFTCARLDRDSIPKNLYVYDVRDDDFCSGVFAQIQNYVLVNHWGTIIGKEPIPFNEWHCYYPTEEDGGFTGDYFNLQEYLEAEV